MVIQHEGKWACQMCGPEKFCDQGQAVDQGRLFTKSSKLTGIFDKWYGLGMIGYATRIDVQEGPQSIFGSSHIITSPCTKGGARSQRFSSRT